MYKFKCEKCKAVIPFLDLKKLQVLTKKPNPKIKPTLIIRASFNKVSKGSGISGTSRFICGKCNTELLTIVHAPNSKVSGILTKNPMIGKDLKKFLKMK